MLALLCAFVAASLRSRKEGLLVGLGAIVAVLLIVTPKKGSVEGASSVVPSLLAVLCIGLVCAAYYTFSPAHRTYSSLGPALPLLYVAILPWAAPRFFKLVRRIYKRIVNHSYQPPPTDESCGPIGWRKVDEVTINARGDR